MKPPRPANGRNGVIKLANLKAKRGSSSQPIVRHPLFPTIVAVWFAALFGLGSLAVRTSLLESLVIASKLDLLVPQTAPPLGMTARILIAIAMAAIGSILGFVLALRLARPKPEMKQERVRTARAFGPSGNATPESAPYLPADEQGQDEQVAEPERRRALLASNEGLGESPYSDEPGFIAGMPPHILDVTTCDVDPIDQPAAEPEQPLHAAPALELDEFDTVAPPSAPGFESVAAHEPVVETGIVGEAQPVSPDTAIDHGQQPVDGQSDAAPAIRRPFEAPAGQGIQRFAAPTAVPLDEPVHQAEAQPGEAPAGASEAETHDAPAPHAFVAPVTSPLQFRVDSPAIAEAPAPAQPDEISLTAETASLRENPALAPETDDADPMAAFRNRIAPMPVFDAEPDSLPVPAPVDVSVSAQFAPPLGAAAERLAKADLADLSPIELIERLALSLQRRSRAVTIAPAVAASQPASMPSVAVEPEPAVPAEIPTATDESEASPSCPALPAALRPIDFSQYEQDDDLPVHVPARSIAMPSLETLKSSDETEPQVGPVAVAAAPQENPVMPRFGRPVESEGPSAQTEEDVLEAGYSSLLDMSRPAGQRQQFVRVIDPEADAEAAEPVVIFPGQAMRAGTRFAAPSTGPVVAPSAPPPSLADTAGRPRRFDAPAAATPARDPEETERALRSALATLQRMSGAA
jgi:hypothetical protein